MSKPPTAPLSQQRGLLRGMGPGCESGPVGAPALPRQPESLWQAMQWVVTHPATADTTQLQKEARKWLKGNRHEFLSQYAEFENAAQVPGCRAAAEAPPGP